MIMRFGRATIYDEADLNLISDLRSKDEHRCRDKEHLCSIDAREFEKPARAVEGLAFPERRLRFVDA